MTKELVTIEFRYADAPKGDWDSTHNSKTVTIGVFDTFEEACIEGNKYLERLESKFPLHVFPDGRNAAKDRFSKNGGCFGGKKNLITDLAYLKTPFVFYAKITTLKYADFDETMNELTEARKRYIAYKKVLETES
jgi:hypothetical protein